MSNTKDSLKSLLEYLNDTFSSDDIAKLVDHSRLLYQQRENLTIPEWTAVRNLADSLASLQVSIVNCERLYANSRKKEEAASGLQGSTSYEFILSDS